MSYKLPKEKSQNDFINGGRGIDKEQNISAKKNRVYKTYTFSTDTIDRLENYRKSNPVINISRLIDSILSDFLTKEGF